MGGCSGPVGLFFIFAALKPEPALEKCLASYAYSEHVTDSYFCVMLSRFLIMLANHFMNRYGFILISGSFEEFCFHQILIYISLGGQTFNKLAIEIWNTFQAHSLAS